MEKQPLIEEEKKELGAWWMWILGLVVVSIIILTVTGYLGKITGTAVEREVFEQSYQRSEAVKSEIATYSVQIASLEGQLLNPNLDAGTKANISAQLSAIKMQLNIAKGER